MGKPKSEKKRRGKIKGYPYQKFRKITKTLKGIGIWRTPYF